MAPVPGWKRYPYADAMLERLKNPNAGAGPIAADNSPVERQRFETFLAARRKAPVSDAEKEQLYREFLDWSSKNPKK